MGKVGMFWCEMAGMVGDSGSGGVSYGRAGGVRRGTKDRSGLYGPVGRQEGIGW